MTHTLRGTQRPERNPLEFVLCLVLLVSLIPVTIGTQPLPGSLTLQPTPFGQMSAGLTALGSLGVMLGIGWRDRDTGLLIQQASMWFLSIGLMFYGAAVWDSSGWTNGRIAISLAFGVALGSAARIWQFQQYVRHRREGRATG